MKVYIVKHCYDNGESYEDYREYEDWKLFSTYQKAADLYWASVVSEYEGGYTLIEWELNTQKKSVLEESAYIRCSSWYERQCCEETYEPEPEDYEYDPWEIYAKENNWYDDYSNAIMESTQEELALEEEWLVHENENYELFKELDRDNIEDLCAVLLIDENPVTGGCCARFIFRDRPYYADLSKMSYLGNECMIFDDSGEGIWDKRDIPISQESLRECVKEYLLLQL